MRIEGRLVKYKLKILLINKIFSSFRYLIDY